MEREGLLYPAIVRSYETNDTPYVFDERLTQAERNFHFAMNSNGYNLTDSGWEFNRRSINKVIGEFEGQSVSFFGPNFRLYNLNSQQPFYSPQDIGHENFRGPFSQKSVNEVIQIYRDTDEDQAVWISYVLGGLIRQNQYESKEKIAQMVDYAAKMTKLGDKRSGLAVASSVAMYLLSGGPQEEDRAFTGNIYHMADAISRDPVIVDKTENMGLSQIARIQSFTDSVYSGQHNELPDITEEMEVLKGFPTVGGEFHFTLETLEEQSNFWKKLALLNLSQYQKGSYIQLSRNDRGLLDVRMNPSNYPITIANWRQMQTILPSIDDTFFTLTLNRNNDGGDFKLEDVNDIRLIKKLQSLCILTYMASVNDVPPQTNRDELSFGEYYLGQTVRKTEGEYKLTGFWMGNGESYGQLAMYAGFGNNFPYLATNLSLALVDPDILSDVPHDIYYMSQHLRTATNINRSNIRQTLMGIQAKVKANKRLSEAHASAINIEEKLSPRLELE